MEIEIDERKMMNCPKCQKIIDNWSNFCFHCGIQLKPKSKQQKTGPAGIKYMNYLTIIFFMIFILFLTKLIFDQNKNNNNHISQNDVSQQYNSAIYKVAKHFNCACGNCGIMGLDECSCKMPGGAVEEKNFILTKLNQGHSTANVVLLVEKQYGHKKTTDQQ